ncbi:hypothetical protein ACOID8_35060, partial [Klebsiella pneumoniae]|uniref:hypothetical protein n=1 Tax=Klebsiella pneumoniae TaxID=573 RepID=UPI003B59D11B
AAHASVRGVAGEVMAVSSSAASYQGGENSRNHGTFPRQAQDENRMHLYHGYTSFHGGLTS